MIKHQELDKIAEEIARCEECKVGKSGKPVAGEGNPDADIIFIGEAPGRQEALRGKPFIGRSGQLLRSFIREIGLKESDVYITSPVKYLPDRGTPAKKDIEHGRIHLMKQFAVIEPKLVVLLGGVAAQGVLQEKLSVNAMHGKAKEKDGIRYFFTFHPAAALRFPPLKKLLTDDFQKIRQIVNSRS